MTDHRPSRESIRAVARALEILRVMNARQSSSLHELFQEVGLPKPTIFRILETLQQEGYVQAELKTGHYRLTAKVRELGAGYTEKSQIVDVGAPVALQLTRQIKWPLAIGTLDGDAIVVSYTTMPYSPLAIHTTTLGHRLGLLETAMGRAYLAYCSATERESLTQLLRQATPDPSRWDSNILIADIAQVRREGYAVRRPVSPHLRGSATLAVPILHEAFAVAALGMTTFGSMMTADTVAKYLPVLRDAASEIARAYAGRLLADPGE